MSAASLSARDLSLLAITTEMMTVPGITRARASSGKIAAPRVLVYEEPLLVVVVNG